MIPSGSVGPVIDVQWNGSAFQPPTPPQWGFSFIFTNPNLDGLQKWPAGRVTRAGAAPPTRQDVMTEYGKGARERGWAD